MKVQLPDLLRGNVEDANDDFNVGRAPIYYGTADFEIPYSYIEVGARRGRKEIKVGTEFSSLFTVASDLVFAKASCIGLSKSSKFCSSSIASPASSADSKTMNAWPLALMFFFATISTTSPKVEKISRRASVRRGMVTRSSRFRTYVFEVSVIVDGMF